MKASRIFQLFVIGVLCGAIMATPLVASAQKRPRSEEPPDSARKIVPAPRDGVNVDVWFDKQCGASYAQQEKIIINFKTSTDGYVTIYDVDTRGQVNILFPNRHYPDNFVRGNQIYSMPNPSYTYDLMVEGPEGIEYVDAVASTDPYYHWRYNQSPEPRWLDDWGLKGRQQRDVRWSASRKFEESQEYAARPREFGETGKRSIAKNFELSQQLRDQIRSKLVVKPRYPETGEGQPTGQYGDYATATCYFYVNAAPFSTGRPMQPVVSREDYLRRQERDLRQIPNVEVSRSGERLIVVVPNTILFDYDSYELRYEARRDLDQVVDVLLRYPETDITVAGHTDSIGDANYNQRLSEYRAQSVSNYLISRGVQPYRISSVGYGEMRPIASNSTEAGRQRNRRVELDIRVNARYGY